VRGGGGAATRCLGPAGAPRRPRRPPRSAPHLPAPPVRPRRPRARSGPARRRPPHPRRRRPHHHPRRVAARQRGGPVTLAAVADDLAARLPAGAVRRDVPVSELTTYRLGGPISVVARVTTDEQVAAVAAVVSAADPTPALLVVGRGSNLLVSDRGFTGLGVVLDGQLAD